MSIASELQNYADGLGDAYDAVNDMNGILPAQKNMNNLDAAIRTIPQPTVNDGILTIQKNGTQVATFTANQASNATANITVPTDTSDLTNTAGFITSASLPGDMTGATSGTAGAHGLVPAPSAGDENKVLSGAGTWVAVSSGGTYTAGNGISIDANNEISIDDTVVAELSDLPSDFTGATSSTAGAHGLVPAPAAGDEGKVLLGDGTWATLPSGGWKHILYATDVNNQQQSTFFPTMFRIFTDSALTADLNVATLQGLVSDGPTLIVTTSRNEPTKTYYAVVESVNGGENGQMAYISVKTFDIYHTSTAADYTFITAASISQGTYYWTANERTIPNVYNGALTIEQNGVSAGTFTANQSTNSTISLTDTTYSNFTGATSGTAGAAGLVPAPSAGDEGKALHGDGTWKDATAKLVEMSYGESSAWAKFIAAYNAGSIVYCRASSNANPATGAQTRKAFMAYVNNETNPTSVEFQYVRSVSSKTDSQQCDQVFVYTLTNTSGGTWSVASRNMAPKVNVSGPITKTFTTGANATVTIGADAMTGATSGAAGAAGVVPAPAAGDQNKVLLGNGTWSALGAPASGYLEIGAAKIQWGVDTVTMNGTTAGSYGSKTVTLNTAMSGTNYAVAVTPQDPGATNALKITAQSKQTGQFTVTAGTAATSGSATITFSWIVIGV